MTMIRKLLKLGRRQLHTIISRETIKPSSPTPSHLRTYNLSLIDQIANRAYVPLIFFYPNHDNCLFTAKDKAHELRKSLSQSLTRYYPFAGRLPTPETPYVDCNDEGVVFLEAQNDSKLRKFQQMSEHDETLDQLFPDGLVCLNAPHSTSPVAVQLNHFACGGVGLAVSFSHMIGDGCTLGTFMNHWAGVARYGSADHEQVLPFNPDFIQSLITNSIPQHHEVINQGYANRVTRKFVFPNSKLSDLKSKITVMAAAGSTLQTNPTRVEALTSLLYKTAVSAATTKSGCFKPSYLFIPMDIRSKFVQKLPQTTIGNVLSVMMVPTRDTREISLTSLVAEMKREKVQLDGVQSVQHAIEKFKALVSKLGTEDAENVAKRSYWCSSLCGFPYNKVDFGWGKPMGATLALRSGDRYGFLLMDTPDGDGIEALVILDKEDMEIFQNDKEMLSFC